MSVNKKTLAELTLTSAELADTGSLGLYGGVSYVCGLGNRRREDLSVGILDTRGVINLLIGGEAGNRRVHPLWYVERMFRVYLLFNTISN